MKREPAKDLVSKWKQVFSNGREAADRASANLPPKKDPPNTAGTALTLIRKEPVTFRLTRLENAVDFDRMRFVIKAVETRSSDFPFKSVLHVERTRTGSRLVATDGQRLHIAEISKRITSGEYRPLVTKDTITLGEPVEGIKFPIWNKAENASREFSYERVKALITQQTETYGWEFIFMGANIDVAAEGGKLGIKQGRSFGFTASATGVCSAFSSMHSLASAIRTGDKQ